MQQTQKLFGTDGIRGVANTEPLTVEMAVKVGRAAAHIFKRDDRRHRIVIGKDTRLSGYILESALVAGICSMGVDVLLVGPLPTPGVAFITRSLRADAGIVLSASHNTYEDNGIKFFSHDGNKLPDSIEKEMEGIIFSGELDAIRPTAIDVGKAYRIDDAVGRYVEYVKNSFPRGMTLEGLKIVLDCANGAMYKAAPQVFRELGAEIIVCNDEPDGTNINKNCGSMHPDIIRKAVIETRADIGIAYDGDGDRVIMADECAQEIDGDGIMAICCLDLLKKKKLKNDLLVATVMSNAGLEAAVKKAGGRMVRTAVGDRYVLEAMIKEDATLGGEQSGHIIFRDYSTTGDGLISALQLLRILKEQSRPLSELAKCMERYPQVILNIRVKEKIPIEDIPEFTGKLEKARERVGEDGRVFVRYSGTEPILRILVEGSDRDVILPVARDLSEVVTNSLQDCALL